MLAAGTAEARPIESTVKLTHVEGSMGGLNFEGEVRSPKPKCEGAGRPWGCTGSGGPDELVSDTAPEANGEWNTIVPSPPAGEYYAKIDKLPSLSGKACAGDKSRTRAVG